MINIYYESTSFQKIRNRVTKALIVLAVFGRKGKKQESVVGDCLASLHR